jgi:hypothetical protein
LGARLLSSSLSPVGAMFHDPIEQGLFKANVFSSFFAFDPLVFQDFGTLGKKLLIQDRILNELGLILFGRRHLRIFFHRICGESTQSTHSDSTRPPHCLFNSRLRLRLRTSHQGRALRRFSAILLNSAATGDSRSSPTIGSPRSPDSRVAMSIGIWPSNGTRSRFASRSPPPLPKIW